ncbi:alpha/beta hydrolase [Cellulomonas sp. APG4]|nr:alpha/beta hydrolase [Cellulomonas sp. APG4]
MVPPVGYRWPVPLDAPPVPALRRPRPRPHVRAAAVVGAGALLLAGCVAPKEQTTPPTVDADGQTQAPVEGGIEAYYGQEVAWEECGDLECAVVQAPLDWDDPGAGSIELAMSRSLATGPDDARVGSLLLNPGGPGSSGIEFLEGAGAAFGEPVREAFDLVGFDPRGVGASSAVDCGDGSVLDDFFLDVPPLEDDADVEAARARVAAFSEGCLAATGPLLGHVDTVSAARDLDLLRALLGDEQLHYAGFSYGTFLGATYAELFPERVGRMLLDGALDPSISSEQLSVGQAEGFEAALRAYVEDCQAGNGCPLRGSTDEGMQQIARLVERTAQQPLDTEGGVPLNATLAVYGIVRTLYNDADWPALTAGLEEALTTDTGALLLAFANDYLSRTADGDYLDNTMVAFTAINCLDYPSERMDAAALAERTAAIEEVAPTLGRFFATDVGCDGWAVPSTGERGPIAADGAAPIVVVGTTGDPATPYAWSVSLAEQLSSGVLVTWEGEGHTAYLRSNACVTDAVDAYLVDGTVPEDGLTC